MKSFIKALCCAFIVAGTLSAQSQVLSTTFASNNGQSGNQFDIVATVDVTICSFDVNIDPFNPTETIEVYTCNQGSKVGFENNAAEWTLVATTTVTSTGTNNPTPLGLQLNVQIPAGTTQGFYVTCTSSTNMNYTNGSAPQAVFASDGNIDFLEGTGHSYPFGSLFNPRVWNGNIYYELGFTACPPPPLGDWDSNSAGCFADINASGGGTGGGPIEFEGCAGTQFLADIGGLPNPWDAIVSVGGVPQTNLNSSLGFNFVENIVNVDPFAVGSLFLGNLSFAGLFNALPPTSFALGAIPGDLSWQVVVLDFGGADGIQLSAACTQNGTTNLTLPGPTADDTGLDIDLTLPPFNLAAGVPFYGTSYTNIGVNPNGTVSFGGSDADFTPTLAEYTAGLPRFGVWSDFSPNVAGSVTITYDCASTITASWSGVPYFGQAATSNSFDLAFDTGVMGKSILNLNGLGLGDGSDQVLIGFSAGNGVATDDGPADFTQGAGAGANPTSALYEISGSDLIGQAGGALGGAGPVSPVNSISLIDVVTNTWTSL